MKLNVGDEIYSIHSFNTFTIEYISKDGNSFVLVSSDGKYKKIPVLHAAGYKAQF